MKILQKLEVANRMVTLHVALPSPEAGLTKEQILRRFVEDLARELPPYADQILGGVLRLNGRMTVEMALAAGAVAARMGATAVELFDPATGEYVPVLGERGALPMPVELLPGMVVEVTGGRLFRPGARAVVINVGEAAVNIADPDGRGRGRETGWVPREAVRPVGWSRPPRLR